MTKSDSFDVRIWLCVSSGSDIVHMFYILSSFSHTLSSISLDNDLVIVSSSDSVVDESFSPLVGSITRGSFLLSWMR